MINSIDSESELLSDIGLELVTYLEYYSPIFDSNDFRCRVHPSFDEALLQKNGQLEILFNLQELFDHVAYFMFMSQYVEGTEAPEWIYEPFPEYGEWVEIGRKDVSGEDIPSFFQLGLLWGKYTSLYGQVESNKPPPSSIDGSLLEKQLSPDTGTQRRLEIQALQKKGAEAQKAKGARSARSIQTYLAKHFPNGTKGLTKKSIAENLFDQATQYCNLRLKLNYEELSAEEDTLLQELSYCDGLISESNGRLTVYAFHTIRGKLSKCI